ncbi:hypothetical protein E7T06_20150 [Deinococcus sp. Arct2-2]|uniref:hypothetical protein n=1 Tax=Deinococcus sp. Arct2-2 TaxID=2568653 RepID=UPI0010A328C1|nr:hypothetical protein [Deinococcus sp. Arct2-2]THF67614.1 hypothetical protein E7T06_20150 [Deinococcus sp. Arct2-2]
MPTPFSLLERRILNAKGVSDDQLERLHELGIAAREDFVTVGDPETLVELLPDLGAEVAGRVLAWALPAALPSAAAPLDTAPLNGAPTLASPLIVNTSDAVYCVHCQFKQPKDYGVGDLCSNCGLQAEPIETCYWCASSGPGKFCRVCGAQFVSTAELSLALLLRRDGVAKDDIPRKLDALNASEKDALWGRVRRARL